MATSLDRLVRKEVALGAIREMQPPLNHIGLGIAPFLDVATDDVIFDYIKGGLQDGLAPARAEDAEAELAQKDELIYGQGRAAVVDWSLKDKYTASDVTRYREGLFIQQATQGAVGGGDITLNFNGRTVDDFQARVARHDALRRRKLDNRIEWLIMTAMETGAISYNDGRIKFTVNYGRPADQHNQVPPGGLWSLTTCDPIGDLLGASQLLFDRYGVRPTQGLISQKAVNNLWKSAKFLAAVGVPIVGGTPSQPLDPNYLGLAGYNPAGALSIVEAATNINFTIYDSVYRTRPIGSNVWTNNRFVSDDKVILFPSTGDLGEIDDTQIGFAKTLTAPHPEGNWSSGFYEWEDETRDPWMHVKGSGVKAFPVFPYMEYTYSFDVL
ncbi:MAG TPA: major capsid protein [Nitrospiraceae bacterium]|nr:major capsid protein [Nitrospiraceae bacterium]